MSASEEPEPDMEQANKKKIRKESIASSVADTSETHDGPTTPPPQVETREVKEVTQGVKDVELEAGSAPESIPLPDEESDDLEDSPSNNSTPPPTTQLQGDAAVEQSATGDVTCRDEPEVSEDTTVTENATPVEKGQEAVEPSVLVVEEEVSDVPAGVAKSELARKLWSKPKEDASFSTA
jgi:hypothetical protein